MKKILVLLSVCFFTSSIVLAGLKDPVAILFQVNGKVEYTKNDKKWKKVRRSKFLFAGYKVRSGDSGGGKITNQKNGKDMHLGPNSLIEITSDDVKALKGNVTAVSETNKMLGGLLKRFNKSQAYTTVRRSIKKKNIKINAARNIAVNATYPELVWDNVGHAYSYQLIIDQDKYNIPASKGQIMRAKIKPFKGKKNYELIVLKNNKEVVRLKPYKQKGQKKKHTIEWLDNKKNKKLKEVINEVRKNFPDNSFMLGSLFEKEKMWVAALIHYQQYLNDNPDELEMTPYLFRVYKKLKLNKLYEKELDKYKTSMLQ